VEGREQTGVTVSIDLVLQLPVYPIRPDVLAAASQDREDLLLFDQHLGGLSGCVFPFVLTDVMS
jgi:hypothetical protein